VKKVHIKIDVMRLTHRYALALWLTIILIAMSGTAHSNTQSQNELGLDDRPGSYGTRIGLENHSNEYGSGTVVEFWGYHYGYGEENYSNQGTLRLYQPLQFSNWKGMFRIDTSYASQWGPADPGQSSGQYSAGNTFVTVWGQPPAFLPQGFNLGARLIFPFGNNGQWAIGPQIGSVFKPKDPSKTILADFSPLARYMYGFDTKNNSFAVNPTQPPLLRTLNLFPTVGLQLTPTTQIRFWDENSIQYNTAGGGWFIPIDAMVTQSVNKHLLVAVGASKQVVQTFQAYDWLVYGKISLRF
jgi:hypothetical protein